MKDARNILIETLSERTARNPSYSLRALARDLEISPQQLSNVMTGRRGISPPVAETIATRLELDHRQKEIFCESLKAQFALSKAQRLVAKTRLDHLARESETKNLELDLFKTISSWHHAALIELVKIAKPQKKSITWYSEKLGVTENEVRLSLARLERLELISKTAKGYEVNQETVISDRGIPTDAIKNLHRQVLEKAITALAFQTKDERYGSSSALPVKVKDLEKAKQLIQKFRLEFTDQISDREEGDSIYGLSLQFFRMTQK